MPYPHVLFRHNSPLISVLFKLAIDEEEEEDGVVNLVERRVHRSGEKDEMNVPMALSVFRDGQKWY